MKTIGHVTPANGNVFADLGLDDAPNLKLRAELMGEISRYVKQHKLTQIKAADLFGTNQPRLNDVLNGRIEKCTIDRLVKMLASVGREVTVEIRQVA